MTETRKQRAAKQDPVQKLVQSCNKIISLLHIYREDLEDPKERSKMEKTIDSFSRDVALVAAIPYVDAAVARKTDASVDLEDTD